MHTHTHTHTHAQTRSMFFCRTGSDKLFLIPSRVFPTSCSHNTLFCGTLNVPRCINLHHKFRKACINQPAQPTLGCAVGEHLVIFVALAKYSLYRVSTIENSLGFRKNFVFLDDYKISRALFPPTS